VLSFYPFLIVGRNLITYLFIKRCEIFTQFQVAIVDTTFIFEIVCGLFEWK